MYFVQKFLLKDYGYGILSLKSIKGVIAMLNVPANIEKAINDFVAKVNKLLKNNLKEIILYGSYARGDYKTNSDVDIMILTNLTDEEIVEIRTQIWDVAYDIGLDNDIIISTIIKNINDYNYWLDTLPFYMNIQKEGVVLNG